LPLSKHEGCNSAFHEGAQEQTALARQQRQAYSSRRQTGVKSCKRFRQSPSLRFWSWNDFYACLQIALIRLPAATGAAE